MHAEAKARPDPESVRGSVADQSNEGTDERMTVYMMKCNLLLCNAVFAIKKETRNDSCLSVSRLAVFRFVSSLRYVISYSSPSRISRFLPWQKRTAKTQSDIRWSFQFFKMTADVTDKHHCESPISCNCNFTN